MLTAILALLEVALASTLLAQVGSAPVYTTQSQTHMITDHLLALGKEISFLINEHDLDDSPVWPHPESDPPPLAMTEAIRVASGELKKYVDVPGEWRLCGLALRSFEGRDKWYYVIEWKPRRADHLGDGVSIPVLMTGRAVQGKIEPLEKENEPKH